MISRIALFALALVLGATAGAAAETVLADPKPSIDNPRKIVLQLSTKDPRAINNLLFNAINIQKFYGMDNVQVAVVAFGDGMQALYAKTSPVKERIVSLQAYDIEFVACGNTMDATGHKKEDLINGILVVTAGIPEIVERRLMGWHYIHP